MIILTIRNYGKEMRTTSTISSKGQVTVPQKVRTHLGLSVGDRIEFVMEGGQTILRPARVINSIFDRYKGALRTFPNGMCQINAWVEELRNSDSTDKKLRRRHKG